MSLFWDSGFRIVMILKLGLLRFGLMFMILRNGIEGEINI